MIRRIPARGRPPRKPGFMNKLEAEYAGYLEVKRRTDRIEAWAFEPEKLRLADKTYYTPDFRVQLKSGEIEFHEVKGYWEDDARVKIKWAAEHHPYRFVGVTKNKGQWEWEYIGDKPETLERRETIEEAEGKL